VLDRNSSALAVLQRISVEITLADYDHPDKVLPDPSSTFVYRGMSDVSYRLVTSLARLPGDSRQLERDLLRDFRNYAHLAGSRFHLNDVVWNWLALGQHHGLPTRLLDWTFAPRVALHFATADIERSATDGVIWCVDYVKVHQRLPVKLQQIIKDEGTEKLTVEVLTRAATTLREFDALAATEFVVFFEPPSFHERIVAQNAAFSVMSSATAVLDAWLALHPDCVRKIIIPASLKREIRGKLDRDNDTERRFFPDLDGLSRWLRRRCF
jgi:FRG domain